MMPPASASKETAICLNCSANVRTGVGVLKSPGMFAVPGEKSNLSAGTASAAFMISRSIPRSELFRTEVMVGVVLEDGAELAEPELPCAKANLPHRQQILTRTAICL